MNDTVVTTTHLSVRNALAALEGHTPECGLLCILRHEVCWKRDFTRHSPQQRTVRAYALDAEKVIRQEKPLSSFF